MSQSGRGLDWLPGVFAGTATVAIVISLPAIALAKTPEEVYEIAKTRTVLIKNSSGGWGSGVIISRQGKIYNVLTNHHVACGQQGLSYTIFTYDDKSHPGKVLRCFMQQTNDPDLAVVSFEGTDNYPSAELANSDPVRIGAEIYVYGYPGYLNNDSEILAEPQFSRGHITSPSKLSKPPSGYGLGYSAVT